VKTTLAANSGVYFHQRKTSSTDHPDRGFEIAIDNQPGAKFSTGAIFYVKSAGDSPVRNGEWFELRFKVENQTVETFINGQAILEWTQPGDWQGVPRNRDRKLDHGTIALQLNNPNTGIAIYFKDIEVRLLD